MPLRFLTAGDSHGDALVGIIEGLPAGIPIPIRDIQRDLKRRRKTYGRSGRQRIETDPVEIVSGMWRGRTTGAPVGIRILNLGKAPGGKRGGAPGTVPRPGHADLAGCLKYGLDDIQPIAERASARSTAMRVAIGAVAKGVLKRFSVEILSHVRSIGDIDADPDTSSLDRLMSRVARSQLYCADAAAERKMIGLIKTAWKEGHTLGGSIEVIASGVPPGLGSHAHWDRKLDARLAGALMSIQTVKAVEIGAGLETYKKRGIESQDAIVLYRGKIKRPTNYAGGIEGGISNGENIVIRSYAKPIATAPKQAPTIDMSTLESRESPYVRSDVCVIPALGVIAEAVVAWELLCAILEKFGGDHIEETQANFIAYVKSIGKRTKR
ncbi:MAG: chorismate synthase [Candidatus Latescibacteria bacterium]|nr:chorismate synthase [Candidatus Latescibacterota bacterium]NIM64399.1 chorismate synthase [Candidatus Latescibacterota bacterium]NIO00553.1 chorismate synthase [Candidatus Latescibacterota bacterium]NIO26953.1 chorismate synthase [Candidatus Latescibacterota bacterium]NIO56030.1 chorismate synthase [Candidatus Latescibacterota bacterium]